MSQLDEIEARRADCQTYNFGMRNADKLAKEDVPYLLALVREQAAKISDAWDEGFDRGFYDPLAGSDRDASESLAANPYRAGAAAEARA